MTGFGVGTATDPATQSSLRLELSAVNGRGFELKARLPDALQSELAPLRKRLRDALLRGTIHARATLETTQRGTEAERRLTEHAESLWASLSDRGLPPEVTLVLFRRLLADPGASEVTDEGAAPALLEAATQEALEALLATQRREGHALQQELLAQLDALVPSIELLETGAAALPAAQLTQLRGRAEALLDSLEGPIDSQLLAREIALLCAKADVREELTRLRAHIDAMRALLEGTEESRGRQLEFLLMEANREVNTAASKLTDAPLRAECTTLKLRLEQMREQAANVV